jgi:hypothetical protein
MMYYTWLKPVQGYPRFPLVKVVKITAVNLFCKIELQRKKKFGIKNATLFSPLGIPS